MRKEYVVFTAAFAAMFPTEADVQSVRRSVRMLAPFLAGGGTPILTVTDAERRIELPLPAESFHLLAYELAKAERGRGVAILPLDFELTERQAGSC